MSQRAKVDSVLAEFARTCGLTELILDEQGRAGLAIGGRPLTLSYLEEPAELLVCCIEIAEIADDDQATPAFLAELTFTTWMRGIMTIGLSEDGRRALGYQVIPLELLDTAALGGVAGQLAETALAIRAQLAEGAQNRLAPVAGDGDRPDNPFAFV